jgi:hypothetical protein
MLISARRVRLRKERRCEKCAKLIPVGESAVRLYGAAHTGDPPYEIRLHLGCIDPAWARTEPKVARLLEGLSAPSREGA